MGVAIDEVGFDTIDELLAHYDFNGNPQTIEVVLFNEDDEIVDQRNINTRTIL